MPKIVSMTTDGSRNDLLLIEFVSATVTKSFRDRVLAWLKSQYKEFVKVARWRDGPNNNILLIEIWREELAVALTALKEAVRRRALFR